MVWPAQGVSAWNFDVAALKEQAAREGDLTPLPTISEAPPASAEGGPQSYPLKLHPSGHDIVPGNGERALSSAPQRLLHFRTTDPQLALTRSHTLSAHTAMGKPVHNSARMLCIIVSKQCSMLY